MKPYSVDIPKGLDKNWNAGEDSIKRFMKALAKTGDLEKAAGVLFEEGARYALEELIQESRAHIWECTSGKDRRGKLEVAVAFAGDHEAGWIAWRLDDLLADSCKGASFREDVEPILNALESAAKKIRSTWYEEKPTT